MLWVDVLKNFGQLDSLCLPQDVTPLLLYIYIYIKTAHRYAR